MIPAYVNVHPCAKLDGKQVEDLIKIHSVIRHYDREQKLSRQIQDTLVLSLVLIAFLYSSNVLPTMKTLTHGKKA